MRDIIEYKVIESFDLAILESKVNGYIPLWQPYGSITSVLDDEEVTMYAQPMVRYQDEEEVRLGKLQSRGGI